MTAARYFRRKIHASGNARQTAVSRLSHMLCPVDRRLAIIKITRKSSNAFRIRNL